MIKKNSYEKNDLIKSGEGLLMGPNTGKLPLEPMLMVDRINDIYQDGGKYGKGRIKAELDIDESLWFFHCHFKNDPVMPGCLGLDGMLQLVGFYLVFIGNTVKGRDIGVKNLKFKVEVLKDVKIAKYEVDMKRVLIKEGTTVGLANGILKADGKKIYSAENLKVGLFK